MLESLRYWNDTLGAKFSNSANKVNTMYNEGVEKINNAIQKSNNVAAQRVNIKSHAAEINSLIVR